MLVAQHSHTCYHARTKGVVPQLLPCCKAYPEQLHRNSHSARNVADDEKQGFDQTKRSPNEVQCRENGQGKSSFLMVSVFVGTKLFAAGVELFIELFNLLLIGIFNLVNSKVAS